MFDLGGGNQTKKHTPIERQKRIQETIEKNTDINRRIDELSQQLSRLEEKMSTDVQNILNVLQRKNVQYQEDKWPSPPSPIV